MFRTTLAALVALLLAAPVPVVALAAPDATITITKTGTCPGGINFFITGATPNGQIAIVHGTPGTSIKTGNPCNGMLILVNNAQLGTVLTADGGGAAFFAIPVHLREQHARGDLTPQST
jgi:hypothetical protein